ncbi:MAG: hypothetical protein GC205_00115 [Bacteroidetes bacterium]|nr:hypothetical protein [Bacteroidota bacterium]
MPLRSPLTLLLVWVFLSAAAIAQVNDQVRRLYALADSSLEYGDYSQHLQYCFEAMELAEEQRDCSNQSESYRRMGVAYDYLKDGQQAFYWINKAYQKGKACQEDTLVMRAARYLGALYYGIQNGDSCIHFLQESADMLLRHGYQAEAASAHGMLGEANSTIVRNMQRAEFHYRRSILLARQSGDQTANGYALFRYGCHLARNERCEQGRPYIDSCYEIFKTLNDAEGIQWALNGLAFAESRCGSATKVYDHLTAIQRVSDSLFRLETARQTARFQALYEREKQEREIAALQLKTRQFRTYALAALAGLLLLAAVGWQWFARRNLRREQLAEQELYQVKLHSFQQVLESENNERRRIASDLHDSLGHLLSAARMQLSMVASDEPFVQRTAEIVDEAAREVRHISHNLMPASLQELGLPAALRQMVRNMSPGGEPVISLETEGYSPQPEDREMVLYRMAQEMLTNSIRHGKANHIHVRLLAAQAEIFLAVDDDGRGFDAGNATAGNVASGNATAGEVTVGGVTETDGIGIKTMMARVEMLKGRIEIESKLGGGSKVRIYLPL